MSTSPSDASMRPRPNIEWKFMADPDWVRFWVYNIQDHESVELNRNLKKLLPDDEYFVHARFTEEWVIIQYHHDDILDHEEGGLYNFAQACCRVIKHIIENRDPTLVVYDASVQHCHELRWPSWDTCTSTEDADDETEHGSHTTSWEEYKQLNLAAEREMRVWCELQRAKRAIVKQRG